MENLMDPAIRIATLEATIQRLREDLSHERSRITVLESTSRIEGQEIKRLKRLLAEATYGLAARKDGPSSARAIDKA